MIRRALGGLVVLTGLVFPAGAAAMPACDGSPAPRTEFSGGGTLESVIVDEQGRLFYTDTPLGGSGRLMRIDRPGDSPVVVAEGISNPGGLLLAPDGRLVLGQGNGFVNGAAGNIIGLASLLLVDPDTGEQETLATGLAMANGLARGPDGEIYASDDAGIGIDKVVGSNVTNRWATAISTNGLAVDSTGTYLFAAQTFQPAAILRIPLADPSTVETYAAASGLDIFAGPDGITIDHLDRLFVAANAAGQVWRVGTDRSICSIGAGPTLTSAVAFGTARPGEEGFPARNLYAVGFSGSIVEFPDARPLPPKPPLDPNAEYVLFVDPSRVKAGVKRKFRFYAYEVVESDILLPLGDGERIHFARTTLLTNQNGRASIRHRFNSPGKRPARLEVPGRDPRTEVRVLP